MPRKLKVLALFDVGEPLAPDADLSALLRTDDWKTEAGVLAALDELGHAHEHLVIFDDLAPLQRKLVEYAPDVVFNLADTFRNNPGFDQHIVSFLALHGIPFTGCGPGGLTLCKHKGIAKKILGYHRIPTADFAVIPRGHKVARPRRLKFPLLVKPVKEEASYGIARASFVAHDAAFAERVQFIHDKMNQDAIAEEYIDGRELYASLLGAGRLQVFPLRELVFREVPPDEPKIATYRAKWDEEYRRRWGLENRFATDLDPALVRRIESTCKRIYRLLTIDGYARLDLRLTPQNEVYFIEANPNPILAPDEDFAQSARQAGLGYPQLIDRIARLGLKTDRD
ncbi:MAG TPA: hypothetical protein VHD61_16740 [Lacunisphaera sp.]|nr:hypothetical protein [Lacunisphaera sp.]